MMITEVNNKSRWTMTAARMFLTVILLGMFLIAGCEDKKSNLEKESSSLAAEVSEKVAEEPMQIDLEKDKTQVESDILVQQPETVSKGKGLAAIEHATEAKKYLFIFFYNADNDATGQMRNIFDPAVEKNAEHGESVIIKITDPLEKEIVQRFNVSRAPMPLVLVLAPNGAVTGGFPMKFTEEQLQGAIVGPGMAGCLKGLQQRKLVMVCIQNEQTKSNSAAMQGVTDFTADPKFSKITDIVKMDPADPLEAKLLSQMKVDPKTKEAVTVMLAPPGTIVGMFKGATDKKTLVEAFDKNCGPQGCGPSSAPG